jgi:AcrR family transcriptional regulator
MAPSAETAVARPNREHAIQLAVEMFVGGERVDMQVLAARLGVGRTTLYRWVGDREQLIAEVLAILTRQAWEEIAGDLRGEGLEAGLDGIRRFMELTSDYPPLRRFAETEPGPALRILMAVDGVVAQALREGSGKVMQASLAGGPRREDPQLAEVLVQLGTAMQWAPIVAGEEPAIDRAIDLMRTVLETRLRALS